MADAEDHGERNGRVTTRQRRTTADALAGTRLAFVGAGVMAEAMIAGLLDRQLVAPAQIVASHPREDRRPRLAQRFGIAAVEGNREAATGADLVLLTIKPQVLAEVMRQLHGRLEPRQVAISILAGAAIAKLSRGLGHDAIVRVMPNTPAQIGQGMSVWTATPDVDEMQRERVRAVLGALGEELYVDEEKYVDMATALSGTGPTYVFLMMEALIDAGVHMGFPRRIAEQIVLADRRRLGRLRPRLGQAHGRAAQHGHLARRHLGRGDLPDGEGRPAHRLLPRRLRRLPAHAGRSRGGNGAMGGSERLRLG